MLLKLFNKILCFCGFSLNRITLRPSWDGEKDRFSYQKKLFNFSIKDGDRVLDVGCGAIPFPLATVVVDLHTGETSHRQAPLVTNGKELVVADIQDLPFPDKSFDFVYCSHVLEHVKDPEKACRELMRVGKRGYIEVPSLMTDTLFAWAKGMHRWFCVVIAGRLVFFEYSPRQLEGIRSSYWKDIHFSRVHHPLQDVFFDNLDIFYNGFLWEESFSYAVYGLDGKVINFDRACQGAAPG
ncbi:MAG: class I SAM-dependent methyltransferase [Candidatus Omnitrophica bacterium]|nr:class I SAM-dependent methyltransferase [Candidatus Omnitrophota bacterium]